MRHAQKGYKYESNKRSADPAQNKSQREIRKSRHGNTPANSSTSFQQANMPATIACGRFGVLGFSALREVVIRSHSESHTRRAPTASWGGGNLVATGN